MTEIKEDYQTASGFSELVSFIGFASICISVVGGFVIFEAAGSMGFVVLPVLFATALMGLMLVVAGQSLRAQLETANATKQLLAIEQNKL